MQAVLEALEENAPLPKPYIYWAFTRYERTTIHIIDPKNLTKSSGEQMLSGMGVVFFISHDSCNDVGTISIDDFTHEDELCHTSNTYKIGHDVLSIIIDRVRLVITKLKPIH